MEKKDKKTIQRGRLLYEGLSKRVYETSVEDEVILEFKSEFPNREGTEKSKELRKSRCSSEIAEHIFSYLNSFRIPNHFISRHEKSALIVKRLEMIPVAMVVRNIAAGNLCGRYDLEEGRELEFPVVEMVYRNHQLDNPMVNESHILAFGVSTPEELRTMVRIANKTNAVLRSFMERRRFRLVDVWLEFGRMNGEVLIGDAITPDSSRVMDMDTNVIHDGSIFRLGIGDYQSTYISLYKRLMS